jgi:hypothetical protein
MTNQQILEKIGRVEAVPTTPNAMTCNPVMAQASMSSKQKIGCP